MHPIFIALAATQQSPAAVIAESIVVTGSREATPIADAPVSATVFGEAELEPLDLPLAADLLRLVPGVSVATSGPRGSQTQLRIRGAEASHTLLFVDGIRFNDPAAGNEARFELLTTDALSRVEVVRGPQSALWGSEALGGVIAIEAAGGADSFGLSGLAEYGSLDTARLSGQLAARAGDVAVSGSAGLIRSDGIDSFGAGGERDGFENRTASLKAVYTPLPAAEIGVVGHVVEGESAFDGFDPITFRRADTLDATDNRIAAIRGWSSYSGADWSVLLDGSYLDSANRNRLANAPLNSTFGSRFTLGGQLSGKRGGHRLTGAIEHEAEDFRARDNSFFGATDQDRARDLTAFVVEWSAVWSERVTTNVAVRHDDFSAFADATTARAGVSVRPLPDWSIHASYGEGIAQPTFYDLFGFFPGSFVGNPELQVETSQGWEAGLRWQKGGLSAGATLFSNRLRDEIVDVFDPDTFISSTANAAGNSKRRGLELDAAYRVAWIQLGANYTYLDATERQAAAGLAVREARRAKHSANLIASGSSGRFGWGATLAYIGKRRDTDFEAFPAQAVTLGDYVLASLRLAYRVTSALEAYARVENGFDANYQDAVGYRTAGRTIYAGLRVRLDD